jgi:hypothetical protein
VNLPPGETEGVRGLCLEPHDLAIAKYASSSCVASLLKSDCFCCWTRLRSTRRCAIESATKSRQISRQ